LTTVNTSTFHAQVKLEWERPSGGGAARAGGPAVCLIVKKPNASAATAALVQLGRWLR
jgi:hypothetical protein